MFKQINLPVVLAFPAILLFVAIVVTSIVDTFDSPQDIPPVWPAHIVREMEEQSARHGD